MGREVKQGVDGLFNTVIKEIDYEVAKLLDLEDIVEVVRTLVITMARRRLSRAGEIKPDALRGSEPTTAVKPAKSRKSRKSGSEPPTIRLYKWFKPK